VTTTEHVFQPAGGGRRSDHVVREIRKAMVRGELRPGEKLPPEQELARELGVSRSALREALRSLELSGYLSVRRGYGGGTFVSEPVEEELTTVPRPSVLTLSVSAPQLRDVRLTIEPQAARLAASGRLEDVLALHEAIGRASRDDVRPAALLAALVDFHVAVARASGNPVFAAVMEGLRPAMYRTLKAHVEGEPSRAAACLAEHEGVVRAIESGQGDRAEQAMLAHLGSEDEPDARPPGGDAAATS
jgi:GntR family transcriptional regulator, transcriptional repressor for pyruvate dehydrogenase complex